MIHRCESLPYVLDQMNTCQVLPASSGISFSVSNKRKHHVSFHICLSCAMCVQFELREKLVAGSPENACNKLALIFAGFIITETFP